MKEPILSREQVLKIVRKTLKENNDRDKLSADRFVELAAALESALLEKLCGEPVAHYCEHKHRCKWPGVRGMPAFGPVSDCISAWVEWHERECGGRLISLYTIKDRQS